MYEWTVHGQRYLLFADIVAICNVCKEYLKILEGKAT
jgi:hypothetical protein